MSGAGRLHGRRAVVTGGGNGIGAGIALAFAAEGADVLLTFRRDREAAERVAARGRELGRRMEALALDGGEPGADERLFEAAVAFHGRVDVVVNNAATATRTRFLDVSPEEYARTLDVNLRFPFFVVQRFARHMVEHGVRGSIINVSSISATKAVSAMAPYQCSKAGLVMLTRGAAYELAPHGIRVNTLSPGLTATNANRNQWSEDPELWRSRGKDIPLGRTGLPADHAGAAVFLASDESSWMTGAELVVDGGESVV
ncbi:MAG TPA: SDR family oxidoreductase [Longimicrobium sp.]|nr:SDR family oxidoreductase [Longimicrobium sp.]